MPAIEGLHFELTREPPPMIYHYTGPDGLFGIIENGCIWASKIQYLNDSEEFIRGLRIAAEVVNRREKTSVTDSATAKFFRQITADLEKIEGTNICVCSFSENGDLLSQWRGYSGGTGGFGIGFEFRRLWKLAQTRNFLLGRCVYDADAQRQYVINFLDDSLKLFLDGYKAPTETEIKQESWKFVTLYSNLAALLKHSSFEEEREWRLVVPTRDSRDSNYAYRKGAVITPYYKIVFDEDRKQWPITRVIVGPTPHLKLALASVSDFLGSKGLRGFTVSHSSIPYRGW